MRLQQTLVGTITLLLTASGCIVHGDAVHGVTTGPEFRVQKVTPAGHEYYQVIAYYGEEYAPPIVIIRSATHNWMLQRAIVIKDRLTRLQQQHPDWYRHPNSLKALHIKNGEIVIAPTVTTDTNYIATADEQSIHPMNCQTREQLAEKLQSMILAAFHVGTLNGPARAEAKRGTETAESLAVEADRFYDDNPTKARELYEAALKKANGKYIYVELCLAQLYQKEGETEKARQLLEAAEKQQPAADEQAQIKDLMKHL
jgi:hypothetical protein